MKSFLALCMLAMPASVFANPDAPQTPGAGFSGPMPYAFEVWPWTNYPGRGYPPTTHAGSNKKSSNLSRHAPKLPKASVGIPVEKYLDLVKAGKKINLPSPSGECNVGNSLASARELALCFAALAAH